MALPDYLRKKRGFLELRRDKKWISWNPYHSKLSAYVLANGPEWPFEEKSNIYKDNGKLLFRVPNHAKSHLQRKRNKTYYPSTGCRRPNAAGRHQWCIVSGEHFLEDRIN